MKDFFSLLVRGKKAKVVEGKLKLQLETSAHFSIYLVGVGKLYVRGYSRILGIGYIHRKAKRKGVGIKEAA